MADQPAVVSSELLVGVAELFPCSTFPSTAGDIITSVRDQIPDQIYGINGEPAPDSDVDIDGNQGFVPVRALYRWLTNGIRTLTQMCNWYVLDWYAFPSQNYQATYTLDPKWSNVESAFANRYRCAFLDEAQKVYPSQAVAQPIWYGVHTRKEPLDLFYYPAPNMTDPVMILAAGVSLRDDQITFTATPPSNFLPFGWVRIGCELIQYEQLVGNTISVLRRGCSGTLREEHFYGDEVFHCSLWCKGSRTPRPVFRSTDILEVPLAFQAPLELYVLAGAKRLEQELQQAAELMREFTALATDIRSDPVWQANGTDFQVRIYGEPAYNLLYGRLIVP